MVDGLTRSRVAPAARSSDWRRAPAQGAPGAGAGDAAVAATTSRAKWSSWSAGIRVIGPATDMAATHSPTPSKMGAATDETPRADSSTLMA